MFIYNITTKLDWSIQPEWLQWMQEEHIPATVSSGLIHHHQLVRLLGIDDKEGPTYAVQYYMRTLEALHQWLDDADPLGAAVGNKKWGDRIISFGTIMEVVD